MPSQIFARGRCGKRVGAVNGNGLVLKIIVVVVVVVVVVLVLSWLYTFVLQDRAYVVVLSLV